MIGLTFGSIAQRFKAAYRAFLGEENLTGRNWTWTVDGAEITVNADTAMNLSAVWCAMTVLSESVGMLPLEVRQKIPEGGSRSAIEHPYYPLATWKPNREQTPTLFKRTVVMHICRRGNSYFHKVRNGLNQVSELMPIDPSRVTPKRSKSGYLMYEIAVAGGQTVTLDQDRIVHFRGLSTNGVIGISPIEMASDSMGVDLHAQRYGNRFFRNDAKPGVIIKHPARLDKPQRDEVREGWKENYGGSANAGEVAILTNGVEVEFFEISNEAAQFLETRKFGITEIARWFGVPPHRLMDLENSVGRATAEEENKRFFVSTICPLTKSIEDQLNFSCLSEEDIRQGYYFHFNFNAFLRGDTKARGELYKVGRDGGWLCADEIREWEDLNPIPNGAGKIFLIPLNHRIVDEDGNVEDGDKSGSDQDDEIDDQQAT